MKPEDQVCNSELSKRLKELGVKQESLYYWHPEDYAMRRRDIPPKWFITESKCLHPHIRNAEACSAFTVAELGEMLPPTVNGFVLETYPSIDGYWNVAYMDDPHSIMAETKFETQMEKTEADARAKMLIYLLENNLIQIEKRSDNEQR